jgi:hypothetical protein
MGKRVGGAVVERWWSGEAVRTALQHLSEFVHCGVSVLGQRVSGFDTVPIYAKLM